MTGMIRLHTWAVFVVFLTGDRSRTKRTLLQWRGKYYYLTNSKQSSDIIYFLPQQLLLVFTKTYSFFRGVKVKLQPYNSVNKITWIGLMFLVLSPHTRRLHYSVRINRVLLTVYINQPIIKLQWISECIRKSNVFSQIQRWVHRQQIRTRQWTDLVG